MKVKGKPRGFFTTFDVVKLFKIKRVTLKNWLDEGFIKPTIHFDSWKGPGRNSYFNVWALYMIKLFQHIIGHGIARKKAAEWIQLVDRFDHDLKKDPNHPDNEYLVKVKNNQNIAMLITENHNLVKIKILSKSGIRKDPDLLLTFDFEKIRKAVDRILSE